MLQDRIAEYLFDRH
jgi:nucleoporin SEH1